MRNIKNKVLFLHRRHSPLNLKKIYQVLILHMVQYISTTCKQSVKVK
jgi:hypothetical protein